MGIKLFILILFFSGTACAQVIPIPFGTGRITCSNAGDPAHTDASITLSNSNLTGSCITTNRCGITMAGKSTGKWYWEISIDNIGNFMSCGIGTISTATANFMGGTAASYGWLSNGFFYTNNTNQITLTSGNTSPTATYTTGDVICFALDMDNGALYIGKRVGSVTTWLKGDNVNVGNPTSGASHTGAVRTGLSGTFYAGAGTTTSGVTSNWTYIFCGAFAGTMPAGYSRLSTN